MSRFFGIKYQKEHKVPEDFCRSAIQAFGRQSSDIIQQLRDHSFSFISIINKNDPIDNQETRTFETEKYILHISGRLDHEKLIHEVCKEHKNVVEVIQSDINLLSGDFVLMLYDKINEELLCARDPLGKRPFYFAEQSNYFAFASEMKALKDVPGLSIEMDDLWIADAISTVKSEKFRTPYRKINRLMPGHILHYKERRNMQPYWDLEINAAHEDLDYLDAVSIYKNKLKQAISRSTIYSGCTGAELSGGLDSSGITAMAHGMSKEKNGSFYAFTHAFSEKSLGKYYPYKDERRFSELLSSHSGIDNHIICHADDVGILETMKNTILRQSGPVQQAYSMFSDILYREARKNGVDILLSGFGGDEGTTSRSGGFFDELRKNRDWQRLRYEYFKSAHLNNYSSLRTLTGYVLSRYLPFALDFYKYLSKLSFRPDRPFKGLGMDREFAKHLVIKQKQKNRIVSPDEPNVRERQLKKIMHQHVSQRFEYSCQAAKSYGITYAYPLWDIDLLQFYYSLPAHYKFRNGMGRAIYRDAMKGILPEKIRLRMDKSGATIPTVHQRFINDYEAMRQLILRSKENNRYHYLDYDKMLTWQKRIRDRSFKDKVPVNPGAFFNSLQILLLQEMEREGEFKSGIQH